jgi:hypothetical protein
MYNPHGTARTLLTLETGETFANPFDRKIIINSAAMKGLGPIKPVYI